MRRRLIGVAALAAGLLVAVAAAADNYQFRDGQEQLGYLASKVLNGVNYPIHLLYGLYNGSSAVPVAVDASGNVGVNVQSAILPSGASTAANQTATQAAPGTSSSSATGVQGVVGGLPVFIAPAYAASGVLPVTGSLSATGQSSAFAPTYGRPFNMAFSGTGTFELRLERQFSGDATWYPVEAGGVGSPRYDWSTNGSTTVTISDSYSEAESGVTFRWDVVSCSGCSLTYRLSQ